jgi:uncharacterized membrane protein YphA (DoxX/SURF4 family)
MYLIHDYLTQNLTRMSLLHQSYKTDENLPRWIVIIRLVLGASLIFKASMFFNNSQELTNYFQETAILKNFTWAIPVVPWVHIVGGILIIIGLFTRLASLLQLPLLIVAVFFINLKHGLYGGESDLPLSILVLVLTIFFSFEGAGYYGLDNVWRKPIEKEEK